MQTNKKSDTKKLMYSNVAKPGTKTVFQEKMGKLNKESMGFAAGHHIPYGFFNLLQFNTASVLKPDIVTATNTGLNNPCIHSYFLITRIGKTGKFRFQLLNVKIPIFNGPPFELVGNKIETDLSKTQTKLIQANLPLISNLHGDKTSPVNKPPLFDAMEELNETDFLCWVVSKYVSLKIATLGVTGGRIFNNNKVSFPQESNDLIWNAVRGLTTRLIRNSEEDVDHVNSIIELLKNPDNKFNAIFHLQREYGKSAKILEAHLQNLLAWSFLLHRNIMDNINQMSNGSMKNFSSHEKKVMDTYKKDKGVSELDLFLSKALASTYHATKETKNKDKQKIRTKINNRFL